MPWESCCSETVFLMNSLWVNSDSSWRLVHESVQAEQRCVAENFILSETCCAQRHHRRFCGISFLDVKNWRALDKLKWPALCLASTQTRCNVQSWLSTIGGTDDPSLSAPYTLKVAVRPSPRMHVASCRATVTAYTRCRLQCHLHRAYVLWVSVARRSAIGNTVTRFCSWCHHMIRYYRTNSNPHTAL